MLFLLFSFFCQFNLQAIVTELKRVEESFSSSTEITVRKISCRSNPKGLGMRKVSDLRKPEQARSLFTSQLYHPTLHSDNPFSISLPFSFLFEQIENQPNLMTF